MTSIAVLGYGVVGSGVCEVLMHNAKSIEKRSGEKICLKKILDIRTFDNDPFSEYITNDAEIIFKDAEIDIIVETIGGTGIAYTFTKRALESGKNVVTSNKALVAKHGPELLRIAKENKVNYLFEASVGGGIPIIRPLDQCLAANEMDMIAGILNGTTNYILTKMSGGKISFEQALKEAQQKGYAEQDPSADIEGDDTKRKIAILSSIAFQRFVDASNVEVNGIVDIDLNDINYAKAINSVIKLIGISKRIKEDLVYAKVAPMLIKKGDYLSNVDDVFNAILVKGDAIGEAMFYGKGAGKLPTASAVVADVIDIVRNRNMQARYHFEEEMNVTSTDKEKKAVFVRILCSDYKEIVDSNIDKVIKGVNEGEIGILTVPMTQLESDVWIDDKFGKDTVLKKIYFL